MPNTMTPKARDYYYERNKIEVQASNINHDIEAHKKTKEYD